MKINEVTREQFAQWSFEQDRRYGLYHHKQLWSQLPEPEQKQYLEEADHYLNDHSKDDWPVDILVRLDHD
jgi:hypothetical protein